MADTKISAMTQATTVTGVDTFPIIQAGANKIATLGQLVNLANATLPTVTTVGPGAIPTTADVVLISGVVTLAPGTAVGKKITLISTAAGTLTTSGTTYTYAANGATITLMWANLTWNVLSVYGMV
jgi:hypothetical protein